MTVVVRGLAELNRAFRRSEQRLDRELRPRLARAAEPVRVDAERLAGSQIRNLEAGDPWTGMRVGVTTRVVYVAPKQRGVRSRADQRRRRRNLAGLLRGRAMEPALERNEIEVAREVDGLLGEMEDTWGQGG